MATPAQPYTVLARAYRPRHFDELIGQESLVRTLKNAINTGRIAQAYMLTGVRGVGKTTTARIIARALNYRGPDGTAGPTTGPTDDCTQCTMIAEGRHPDILEIDAASHTGVDNIRQLLESVPYAPSMARYKVTIIDEVHMLSTSAFNALLKTLEEPPPHVVFVFATTEIRKVPVTILSRCQRFDLRRIDAPTLIQHYAAIAVKENVSIDDGALALIARAADGSVRDGLSLMDRAMALAGGPVDTALVQSMLGLSDRSQMVDLTLSALGGSVDHACKLWAQMNAHGADAVQAAEEMLGVVHHLTRIKALESPANNAITESDRLLTDAAGQFTIPALTKAWQILLRGLQEIRLSPDPANALEMIVFRLAYALPLPDPADLVGDGDGLGTTGAAGGRTPGAQPAGLGPTGAARAARDSNAPPALRAVAGQAGARRAQAAPVETPLTDPAHTESAIPAAALPVDFAAAIALLEEGRTIALASQVAHYAHPVHYAAGRIDIALRTGAPARLAQDLGSALGQATGTRWWVSVVSMPIGTPPPTLSEQRAARRQAMIDETLADPAISAIHAVFPNARLVEVTDPVTGSIDLRSTDQL